MKNVNKLLFVTGGILSFILGAGINSRQEAKNKIPSYEKFVKNYENEIKGYDPKYWEHKQMIKNTWEKYEKMRKGLINSLTKTWESQKTSESLEQEKNLKNGYRSQSETCELRTEFQKEQFPTYSKVILIALDGVGRFFELTDTPTMDGVFASGIYWSNAEATIPSDSAEIWGSVYTGVSYLKHKINLQDLEKGKPYENNKYPSIFKILSEKYPEIKLASFAGWWPINTGMIERSVKAKRYSPLTHENFLYCQWLKFKHHWLNTPNYDESVLFELIDHILKSDGNSKEFISVHFTDIDEYAHLFGFGSKEHLDQIKITDSYLKSILRAIHKVRWKETLIIITTDHGGINKLDKNGRVRGYHGGGDPKETQVFVVVYGQGIESEKICYKVNNTDCTGIIFKAFSREIPEHFDVEDILKKIEVITTIKNQIQQVLKDHNLKTSDLPTKYQNWEEQLTKLKSEEEINSFAAEMNKQIEINQIR